MTRLRSRGYILQTRRNLEGSEGSSGSDSPCQCSHPSSPGAAALGALSSWHPPPPPPPPSPAPSQHKESGQSLPRAQTQKSGWRQPVHPRRRAKLHCDLDCRPASLTGREWPGPEPTHGAHVHLSPSTEEALVSQLWAWVPAEQPVACQAGGMWPPLLGCRRFRLGGVAYVCHPACFLLLLPIPLRERRLGRGQTLAPGDTAHKLRD